MSFQSDILCDEDQKFILEDIGDTCLLFGDEGTLLSYSEPTKSLNTIEFESIKIPKPLTTMLSNEEYIGPYNFEVDVIPNGSKNAWVYSSILNKIYMDMRSPFPIDFKVKQRPNFPLFIRVTPVYSLLQFAQDCVYRCVNHEFIGEPSDCDLPSHVKYHVIRCHNRATQYIGDKLKNERLSVIIPLSFPQTGTDTIREMFEFTCKNSCPSPGMNRRPVEVIFTLEDSQSHIWGRKALNVRICSCPKRDKEKDERDNDGKQKPPQGKKRKLEKSKKPTDVNHDNEEYTITIPVVGNHNVKDVLTYCQNLMAGEIMRQTGASPEAVSSYRDAYSKIGDMLKECSK